MKHTESEILRALHTIQDVCDESSDCPVCPLHNPDNHDECMVSDDDHTPVDWHIKKEEKLFEAFEEG